MMDCQYVATQRGGVALVFEGHRYNKVRDGKDGTVYWRCSRDRQCPGRAVTVHSRIKKANNKHNHSPDNGMTSTKPILNSNSLISNTSGSTQNTLAFDVAAALLRNHSAAAAAAAVAAAASTANHSNPLNNSLTNQLGNNMTNHSNNHHSHPSSNHHGSSPANSLKQNLTEATMAALLGTNINSMNNSGAAAAIASLLTQQQKPSGQSFGSNKSNVNNSGNLICSSLNNKTGSDYLTNRLNDQFGSPVQLTDGQKDNQQFRDNLLSTGSTNYLSNASSSSTSSSPLISLGSSGQAPSFQNTSNTHRRAGQSNFNKLDLFGQFSSANQAGQIGNAINQSSCQSPSLNSFSFDQFKSNGQNKNGNCYPLVDQQNATSKLNPDIPSALSYLSKLNSLKNYTNSNLSNLTKRLGSSEWAGRGSQQLNKPLNQLLSNGQLNQLFAQFELERLTAHSNDLASPNQIYGAYSNGDEVGHKKFKSDSGSAKKILDQEYGQLNCCLKKNGKGKPLNNENKKDEQLLKNKPANDCELSEDEENFEEVYKEIDEKKEVSSDLPEEATSGLDLIKLDGLLNNPTMIFETLNQLSLTNPQMASTFAFSLLGQLDPSTNLQSANVNLNLEKRDSSNQSRADHLATGSDLQSNQLNSPVKRISTDQKTESKLKVIDCYSNSSDEEDQPLNMTFGAKNQIVRKLRQLMKNLNYVPEPLQAYIVPACDAHQSEYIAKCDERQEYLTGFTGSAGTAVVTTDETLFWTDGRYFAQAEKELADGWKLMKSGLSTTPKLEEYLTKKLQSGSKIGVDSKLFSYSSFKKLNSYLNPNGIELIPLMDNLIDLVWPDKPDRPYQSIEPLDAKFCGLTWQEKVQQVRTAMQQKSANVLLLSALDETAWLFNLRGSDIPYNPVFFAYTILTQDCIYLFVEEEKLSLGARKQLGLDVNTTDTNSRQLIIKQQQQSQDDSMTDSPSQLNLDEFRVQIRPYAAVCESLKDLINTQTGKVWISSRSSFALVSLVPENRHIDSPNPVLLKKAVKNLTEVECMRNAHIKDAVALCEFFAWLEEEVPKGSQTETSAAKKLFELRKEQENFIQNSFETISSSGPNGAIIHYRPTESTNRSLNTEEIYLCDSGGHYLDGTTDVTRTMHFGNPSDVERQMFTRVVKGHIGLASCIFPTGAKGHCLDVLARMNLWQSGLDYLHGTGHGVGCYLNVHEGPVSINSIPNPDDPGLSEGMILSNEPGYYEQDKFGIRIESLVVVTKKETQYNFNNKGYLCFDTITLVPIQTKLLDPSLLTVDEIEWLDNYHQTCREIVGNALKKQGKTAGYKWLMKETQPLG